MFWITLIFAAVTVWAVLSLVATDHATRTHRMHARMREEIEHAARQDRQAEAIPVIGAPPELSRPSPDR